MGAIQGREVFGGVKFARCLPDTGPCLTDSPFIVLGLPKRRKQGGKKVR